LIASVWYPFDAADEGHSDLSQDRQPARRATKLESTGIEVDDALIIAEQIEIESSTTGITPVVASAPLAKVGHGTHDLAELPPAR